MKYAIKEKMITIKRAIHVDSDLIEFIFRNSNYRRHVWNDFVEEYQRCKNSGEKFDPLKYSAKYYEINGNESDQNYCIGIREQVAKDVKSALKTAKQNGGILRFRSFDRFRCSFKVHCKPQFRARTISGIKPFKSRVFIHDEYTLFFRESRNNFFEIHLKEAVSSKFTNGFHVSKDDDYIFRSEDIKTISFMHELGKFFILLEVFVKYKVKMKDKNKKKAGIDLGIHNPFCLYDGNEIIVGKMTQKELNRIHYLERRIRRLQHIMDRKERNSNNYLKLQKKLRISYRKIHNIRLNWRRHCAKRICTSFESICVDNFRQPGPLDHEPGLCGKNLHKVNAFSRMHAMSLFYLSLEHAADKYNCKFVEAPKNTTRTCSLCGFKNKHLPIQQRVFVCFNCGHHEDRDSNAAKNCYMSI